MKFRIRGAKHSPVDEMPALVRLMIDFLDKLPDGELIEGHRELAGELNRTPRSVAALAIVAALACYRVRHPRRAMILWANKKTIAEFRKRFPSP
jgi:hypothetical protein